MEAAADSGSHQPHRSAILGVPFDAVDRDEALLRIQSHLAQEWSTVLHVLTLNPEQVMAARSDTRFWMAIDDADLIVCDGVGTLLAARLAGDRRTERLTGVDLIDRLAVLSGFRESGGIYLLGGRDAPSAADRLRQRYPAARMCGAWSGGSPDSVSDDASLGRMRSSGADVLLVGYGAPAQVFWIQRNRDALSSIGIRIAIGVGGAIDYLSGHASPAPDRVKSAGLEWAWRLAHEPWRWKRQLRLLPFAVLVATDAVRRRLPYRILGRREPDDREQDSIG